MAKKPLIIIPILALSTKKMIGRRPSALKPHLDDYPIEISRNAKLTFNIHQNNTTKLLDLDVLLGQATQCRGMTINDEREVALGLDFGTSSTKAVIGDPIAGVAFAVPFTEKKGVGRYLLPCRIYETDGVFSLVRGRIGYRDLKLSLVANPTSLASQIPVVAFLAYAIRYARFWLFHEHEDKYRNTRIVWKLAVGLPAAYHLNNELSQVFTKIARTAWMVSILSGQITIARIRTALAQCTKSEDMDVEVHVVPEIAAQIYGFVKSHRFDRKARNVYLMVDVGAGSVDSSLFHVKPARGGRWDFEFFTSLVEPNGVMNLHRHRINWWRQALRRCVNAENLLASINNLKFPTDREVAIPECYSHYFGGIRVNFDKSRKTPDQEFFGRILKQVSTDTYIKALNDGLLQGKLLQGQNKGIPAFYCGGGMRMSFYSQLRQRLRSDPNATWFQVEPRRIEPPRKLDAPMLPPAEFDRLSVAYGLSFLEVGEITKAIPPPQLNITPTTSWRDNYISNDQC